MVVSGDEVVDAEFGDEFSGLTLLAPLDVVSITGRGVGCPVVGRPVVGLIVGDRVGTEGLGVGTRDGARVGNVGIGVGSGEGDSVGMVGMGVGSGVGIFVGVGMMGLGVATGFTATGTVGTVGVKGDGVNWTVTGDGVTGAGVTTTGEGVTTATGTDGAGVITETTGAGVTGAGVATAGITGAGVATGKTTGAGVTPGIRQAMERVQRSPNENPFSLETWTSTVSGAVNAFSVSDERPIESPQPFISSEMKAV